MTKVLTRFFWWFILSISTIDRGRFSSHFLLSVDKICFPSSVCESFLKKCWRAQFYLKMAKALTRFFRWFILSISTPTMDRGRFSSHFRLSVDKMCFSSSVCESFLKKCWRAQFYLKMAKAQTLSLGWFILSISMPSMDRGQFSAQILLSVDKMCFPSSVCESFLK